MTLDYNKLTRPRDPHWPDCWHIYRDDIHAGTIAVGMPTALNLELERWILSHLTGQASSGPAPPTPNPSISSQLLANDQNRCIIPALVNERVSRC